MWKKTSNAVGAPIQAVQGKDIVVIVCNTTGNIKNCQVVYFRPKLNGHMIGHLNTS
jgi:hypothetical protein